MSRLPRFAIGVALAALSLGGLGRYERALAARDLKTRLSVEKMILQRRERLHAVLAHPPASTDRTAGGAAEAAGPGETPAERSARIHAYLTQVAHLRYGLLYQQLHLSPGKQAAFDAIAAEGEERFHDIDESVKAQGLDWQSPEFQTLTSAQRKATLAEESALLSPDQAQSLDYYDRTEYARKVEAALAGELYSTEPLSTAQAQAITSTMVALTPGFVYGGDVGSFSGGPELESRLAGVLSPAQLKLLTSIVGADRGIVTLNELESEAKKQ